MDSDVLKVAALLLTLVFCGVLCYGLVTMISLMKRKAERAAFPAGEAIDAVHARLAGIELLEARVNELEERLDFAERFIAGQQEPERLPSGPAGHR